MLCGAVFTVWCRRGVQARKNFNVVYTTDRIWNLIAERSTLIIFIGAQIIAMRTSAVDLHYFLDVMDMFLSELNSTRTLGK